MNNPFDEEYIRISNNVINNGSWKLNDRTGKKCKTVHSDMGRYDLSFNRFPALTTKKLSITPMIGELLGFIRGADNAKDFRDLGCNFWDMNANKTKDWLENPNRRGTDDLGRIYGVQGRNWINKNGETTDQLKIIVEKLKQGIDDRRLILNYWNPGELDEMALPPCHDFYQFHLLNNKLSLSMYQRSNDIPLGTPMNIASSSLLLILMAKIVNATPHMFTHFMGDIHIYEDQYELMIEQVTRTPFAAPKMVINPDIKKLEDLETWVTNDDFALVNYKHHSAIKFPFSE